MTRFPGRFAGFCLALIGAFWLPLGSSTAVAAEQAQPQPLSRSDRNAIQSVITQQIKALMSDDNAAAFAMTAPEVRRQFAGPDAFADMVRKGFEPLLRNQSTAFLEAAIIDEDVIQPMRIVVREGSVLIALFSMERQANGDWRVFGCQLAPSDLQAA